MKDNAKLAIFGLNPYSTGSNSNSYLHDTINSSNVLILILLEVTQISPNSADKNEPRLS